jgi:hypothetical protein
MKVARPGEVNGYSQRKCLSDLFRERSPGPLIAKVIRSIQGKGTRFSHCKGYQVHSGKKVTRFSHVKVIRSIQGKGYQVLSS